MSRFQNQRHEFDVEVELDTRKYSLLSFVICVNSSFSSNIIRTQRKVLEK